MLGDRIATEDADLPGVGRQQPARQPDRRRLTGAVGPDQAEHLAGLDVERQAVNGDHRAVAARDADRTLIGRPAHSPPTAELRLDRHARLENAGLVVGRDLDAVHEFRALVGGLHVARRELGLRRDEGDRAGQPLAGIGHERRGLADLQLRHQPLVDVEVGPRVIEIGDDGERRARRGHFPGVEQLRGHDARRPAT